MSPCCDMRGLEYDIWFTLGEIWHWCGWRGKVAFCIWLTLLIASIWGILFQ